MSKDCFKYFEGKRILITGGSGYLAHSVLSLLKDTDCNILCLDIKNIVSVFQRSLACIRFVQGDITKQEAFKNLLMDIDVVFHFAAQTSVYAANENPVLDYSINVLPMLLILETCQNSKLNPVILFSGTVTEAGIPTGLPVNENHPDNPITVYDLHKLITENYLKYYVKQGFVKGAVLRLANVYGPGPKSSSSNRGILNAMVCKAINGEDLTLYGEGKFIRDYIHVNDVALAFLCAAAHIDSVNGMYFVIGSGQGNTIAEVFNLVADRVALKTKRRVKVLSIPPPCTLSPIENRNFIADSSKFINSTGWHPEYTLVQGIDSLIQFYLNK